jgi:hypothetical protein
MNSVVNWLLEKENPEVRYCTLTELVEADDDKKASALEDLLSSDTLSAVMEKFSLGKKWETYSALGALAEFGLTRRDVAIDSYVDKLIEETNFQMMCGEAHRCAKAWAALERRRDEAGRYILDKSLSKVHYKIGKPGKPNKWVTLYALLAQKYKQT